MARINHLKILAVLSTAIIGLAVASAPARAERIRDLVSLYGAPENQLVGFGLVVGLPGTGDQTTQVPYTQQAISNMLSHEGITLPATAFMQPLDVAAVMVTAMVPPYKEPGGEINVTVSAVGNATSLAGGVLLPTPLKGGNGLIYAQAQGPLLVSGFSVGAGGASTRTNTPTVGRLPHGAILSRAIPAEFEQSGHVDLLLRSPSFTTATRIAEAIDRRYGTGSADPVSPGEVVVHHYIRNNSVTFVAAIMRLQVTPQRQVPTVVVDAQSGTIVMGEGVELGPAVVSHGDLTVKIQPINSVSQPGPFSNGQTAGVQNTIVSAKQKLAHVVNLPHATTLAQVAAALNAVGATPADLVAIVEALHEAGALKARIKVV